MGLFDFAKDIGEKLFVEEDEASDKIKARIEEQNPGVDGVQVQYTDGVATLSGQADSQAAREKAVLMAGNVQGVEKVVADNLAGPEHEEQVEYYEIQSGDTLSAIAERFLGSASDHPKIFEANREVIKDPDLIYPGQKIRIPKG